MKYRISKLDNNLRILEIPTGLIIQLRNITNKQAAQQLIVKLNSGSGFDGFTPEFFTK